MVPLLPLPPYAGRSPIAVPATFRGLAHPAATLCLFLAISAGCRSGARLSDAGRAPRDPAATELTRPVSEANTAGRTADISGGTASQSLAAIDERPADKPRRLLPSWFRGQEEQSVPLPATPAADERSADEPTGPVEQFQ